MTEIFTSKESRQIFTLISVGILILGSLIFVFRDELGIADSEEKYNPSINLADDKNGKPGYIILTDEPQDEEDMAFIATLSSIIVHGGENNNLYHPFFILENGELDDHQMWTLNHMSDLSGSKFLLFTNNDDTKTKINEQIGELGEIEIHPANNDIVSKFYGFNGVISVGSYKEALWASPLANIENKALRIGKSSFSSQERVWERLYKYKSADYIIAANPDDYQGEDVFYSVVTPKHVSEGEVETMNVSYHIPSLSAVTAELAAYHRAYVVTDIPNIETITIPQEFLPMFNYPDDLEKNTINDPTNDSYKNNLFAWGYLEKMREIYQNYGEQETKHIAIVGSAEAVPQFELYDFSGFEPDSVCSDVVYGFLNEDDLYYMTTAVGRIVNYNVQGASNMIVRTLGYDYIDKMVEAEKYEGDVNWEEHASSWNGYEVADQRLQNSPGVYFASDATDEMYDASYWSTLGAGGGYSSDGGGTADFEIHSELAVSGLVAYRGHGSWHGCFYQWGRFVESNFGIGTDTTGHLEGEFMRGVFLPPQIAELVSCENAKIHGLNYRGTPINMDEDWAVNHLYAGAVGLGAATEVSYSNLGQDCYSIPGQGTGDSEWDINDLWYAAFWDGILDGAWDEKTQSHVDFEVSGGESLRLAENRYIENLRNNFDGTTCSPFIEPPEMYYSESTNPLRSNTGEDEGPMHWKEVSMFAYYGDPAFTIPIFVGSEGEGEYDPWH